ncbi:uncharacterized protein F4812DRAFT_458000 [Daldinia caldariorum]|uniref:uncharacterized protein n=1 Tax=Daldinia caldariorum TaxID=326644 RepID=UPI002007DC57|nr:uncharacterized protein F4812DRAFT_458000 [Daldinia caldariorum]KAI1469461.1 hypothetical protein F4812DRAFT_458000 [Daldinia caldariorum]
MEYTCTTLSCANCGKSAVKRCTGCLNAPEYHPGDAPAIAYCDSKCQRQHWPTHKTQCHVLKKRLMLLRVATLLKTAFLAYREYVFDLPLTGVEHKEGALHLHLNPKIPFRPWYQPFPSNLAINTRHKEAVLAISQCTTALCLLGPFARFLLEGLASMLKAVDVNLQPILPWKVVWHCDSGEEPENISCTTPAHSILLVWLGSEGWVIDVTGCQFGLRDVLVPLDSYFKKRVRRLVHGPFVYTEHETSDLDVFDDGLSLNNTYSKRLRATHERAARLHFAKVVQKRFDCYESPRSSKELLGGTAKEFHTKLAFFESDLKTHMASFVNLAFGRECLDDLD